MPRKPTSEIDIFISHSHKDSGVAEALVTFLKSGVGLESGDIRCTSFTPTGLAIGSPVSAQLRADIDACSYFMPLITEHASGSEFVAFEIGAAWALETPIKPLVLKSESVRMPALLQGLLYCDLRNLESLVQLASELSKELLYAKYRPSPSEMLAASRSLLAATAA